MLSTKLLAWTSSNSLSEMSATDVTELAVVFTRTETVPDAFRSSEDVWISILPTAANANSGKVSESRINKDKSASEIATVAKSDADNWAFTLVALTEIRLPPSKDSNPKLPFSVMKVPI